MKISIQKCYSRTERTNQNSERMSKDKDKRLEEKEKWDAEVARSLSVVELKKAHKLIEDVEKLRKRDAIKSIRERLLLLERYCQRGHNAFNELSKKYKDIDSSELLANGHVPKIATSISSMYESIRLDFQKTLELSKEDFDRLFHKVEIDASTYGKLDTSLGCLDMQINDMISYLIRLL